VRTVAAVVEPGAPFVQRNMLALPATADALAPYGTLLEPAQDGLPFGAADAALALGGGVPRFYLMKLKRRPLAVRQITRHLAVTQCLVALNGKTWYVLLAPPDSPDDALALPDLSRLQAFEISGSQALALHRSTWHAGPYFLDEEVDFVNLELSDTNVVDHHTVQLDLKFHTVFHIQPRTATKTQAETAA
jgi:ureidoglycolate lyase